MTTALFSDAGPMTEAEFVAIGETPERIELFDGSLHVSAAPAPLHRSPRAGRRRQRRPSGLRDPLAVHEATDKVLKTHYYASGGIPWYLLVDPQTGILRLYRLDDTAYIEHSVVKTGDLLHLTKPVVATIDPAELLPR